MAPRIAIGVSVALVALAAAVVSRPRGIEAPGAAELAELLVRPLDGRSAEAGGEPRTFWEALLAPPFATRTERAITLRLGRVQTDPTAARISAERAGELLALEAEGPEGKLGVPLWRAVLDGPAVEHGPDGRTLAFYGCRHSADRHAAPVLDDTYCARLALARSLAELAATEHGAPPLALRGVEAPVRGGVNFEVQLVGETQAVLVTFDGHPGPYLRAARAYRPPTPNDRVARERLVGQLAARAAGIAGLPPLTIEGAEAPVADGVDVRVERLGGRLALRALLPSGERIATHLVSQ